MLNKIKSLADEAIVLQNKIRMDEALRDISVLASDVMALCETNNIAFISYGDAKSFDSESEMVADITGHKPAKGVKNGK